MAGDVLVSWLAHAGMAPDGVVASDDVREIDNADLRREVEALAAGLLERGVTPGDRVALQLPNSVDFLVAALSCLWVGAVFVPLAVTDPAARVAAIVEDCGPSLILTSTALTERHPRAVDLTSVASPGGATGPPFDDPDAMAYMIYTSGTTGAPKGVVIGRRAFAAAAAATIHHLGLGRETRTLCVSPFHFDGSFATLFPSLAAGGSLVIPPRESLLFARFFLRKVASENITYTGFSSSYLRLLLADRGVAKLADTALEIIALGGEVCSGPDVAALWEVAPRIRVFNRYGPTETTIAVTHFEVTREVLAQGGPVPIGTPHDGVTFYVVDGGGTVVTPGAVGELYIGGGQLMAGYWGAPELTASVLRTDVIEGQTVYRTGDLVRVDDAGRYVYVDRADRVVKRNAVRISLVELGDVMRGLPGVNAAVCVAFDNDGRLGIAGFVVTSEPQEVIELRRAAAAQLPESMLPDVIEVVETLPVASSSKVDERRLLSDAGLRPI